MKSFLKNLIITMAGKSTRFPNMRPKWILTDSMSGNLMCVELNNRVIIL